MDGFGSKEEIFALLTRILWDDLPKEADAAVLFGETTVNIPPLIKTLSHLWTSVKASNLAISGSYGLCEASGSIQPGFQEIRKGLLTKGVAKHRIFVFPMSNHLPPCTDAEAWGIVEFATDAGWKSLLLVAPPLHQFRVFVSMVSAIIKSGKNPQELAVWNFVCPIRGWDEEIIHSQSVPKGERKDLILTELLKVEQYYQKGDLVSAAEVLEYMNQRKQ